MFFFFFFRNYLRWIQITLLATIIFQTRIDASTSTYFIKISITYQSSMYCQLKTITYNK